MLIPIAIWWNRSIRSLTLVGGVALHAINVFIATTILPTVVADIGGMDYYAWNTALFVTASILGSALVPKLLSQTGPRNAYLVAAIIFAAGTLACGLAPSMPAMLAGRVVQGLGGGMMLALSYAMIDQAEQGGIQHQRLPHARYRRR